MVYSLYSLATSIAAGYLVLRPKYRPLLGRFAPSLPTFPGRPVWVQACSVGEVGVAKTLIEALQARWPDIPVVLTCSTVTGRVQAETSLADVPVSWFPFDHPWSVRRFFDNACPRALVLIETEVWPNVIRSAYRLGVPVAMVNGRLSDKHHPRYRRWGRLFRPMFGQITVAGMQNAEYAERLAALGMERGRIHVTGDMKLDGVRIEPDVDITARIRRELGLDSDTPVVVFGSTRPGDEELAARCWDMLREEFPGLCFIIAPRHLDRLDEAVAPFKEPLLRRSELGRKDDPQGQRVVVLDTMGELVAFYAVGTVAVVGGSFYPGVDGHNPLESAALGVPTVFGPYMRNFSDAAEMLLTSGGACQVACPEDLADALRGLLSDPAARARMACQAKKAVSANQGAVQRNLDLLQPLIT